MTPSGRTARLRFAATVPPQSVAGTERASRQGRQQHIFQVAALKLIRERPQSHGTRNARVEDHFIPARAAERVIADSRTAMTLSYLVDCMICVHKRHAIDDAPASLLHRRMPCCRETHPDR